MKYLSVIFSTLLFSFANAGAQRIKYVYPRDTSNFRGPVEHVYLYQYELPFDTTAVGSALNSNKALSMSYHFDREKRMTKMLSYRRNTVSFITTFIYGEDGNLIYKIKGKPAMEVVATKDGQEPAHAVFAGDTAFTAGYVFMEKENRIYLTEGEQITRYHYDMDNLTMLISTNTGAPGTRFKLDEKGRLTEIERYTYNMGKLERYLDKRRYEGEHLSETRRTAGDKSFGETKIYDEKGRLSLRRIENAREEYSRKIEYEYPGEATSVAHTFDIDGNLLSVMREETEGNLSRKTTTSLEGGKPVLVFEELSYRDDKGNIIKQYRIDHKRKKMSVAEFHFNYF